MSKINNEFIIGEHTKKNVKDLVQIMKGSKNFRFVDHNGCEKFHNHYMSDFMLDLVT